MNRLQKCLIPYACLAASVCWSQIPRTLAYQGSLTTVCGQKPDNGAYAIVFRLYDAMTGGTVLWQEEQTVELIDGQFSTTLGEITPLTLSFAENFQGKAVWRSWQTAEPIMELGEGLDFVEGFAVSEKVQVAASSVMIINPDDPDKWTVSSNPYDKRIAGSLAGANGPASDHEGFFSIFHHILCKSG